MMLKWFPLANSTHIIKTRNKEKFKIYKKNTKRYEKSAIPYMRKLLNHENQEKRKIIDSAP